jgi:hypothetical protein
MVELNNHLLNLLKVDVNTLDSSNPTQFPPNSNSGIADSCSTGVLLWPQRTC